MTKSKKNWNLNFSWYYEGMHYFNFIAMNVGQNFECCWKYSIFCRNSLILKVLFLNLKGVSPRKKWRNQKKNSNVNFSWYYEGMHYLNIIGMNVGQKFWVLFEIFNFFSKFLNFKGVSPWKKWRIPKKIEIIIFRGIWKGWIT